jgi:hypothetical protein
LIVFVCFVINTKQQAINKQTTSKQQANNKQTTSKQQASNKQATSKQTSEYLNILLNK